eukprot:7381513-Prymnesium_polylepis.1
MGLPLQWPEPASEKKGEGPPVLPLPLAQRPLQSWCGCRCNLPLTWCPGVFQPEPRRAGKRRALDRSKYEPRELHSCIADWTELRGCRAGVQLQAPHSATRSRESSAPELRVMSGHHVITSRDEQRGR